MQQLYFEPTHTHSFLMKPVVTQSKIFPKRRTTGNLMLVLTVWLWIINAAVLIDLVSKTHVIIEPSFTSHLKYLLVLQYLNFPKICCCSKRFNLWQQSFPWCLFVNAAARSLASTAGTLLLPHQLWMDLTFSTSRHCIQLKLSQVTFIVSLLINWPYTSPLC